MDIDVSGWILEFLLRQNSLTNQTLNNLIRVLPLPNTNPRLKKALILRKLQSDIQNGTISERTIEYLEQIEQLDHNSSPSTVSEAMKAAYCTVMMHCTSKLIEETAGDKKVKYYTAVKRLWSVRVCEMERCGVQLVHDDLVRWVHDVEAGVLDVDVCENVLKMVLDSDVVKCVGRYVNEAWETMGPSFLELACETVLNDDGLSEAMGLLDEVAQLRSDTLRAHEEEVSKLNNQSKDSAPTDDAGANSKEAMKAHVPPTHKHVVSRRSRRAKIVDTMEASHDKYDYIPSPEVSKVQEALESSTFELHAAVKDPLPDALRLAESLKVGTSGENAAHDLAGGNVTSVNDKAPSSSHDRKGKALEADGDDDTVKDQNKRIKPSLFERNHTAHTTEWSDSIDTSEEGSPTRPHLPSPQKRKVSPLNIYKMEKLVRQRKKKRWTPLEEDTLRTGVQKYGKGNWKLILSMYRDIFEDRTEVDLKDKWRNLTR
ncbi:putative transcription factor MYB-related family [Helianthus annuus]|nr:putative transcription factor MYB-related family [Helianthus annuus]